MMKLTAEYTKRQQNFVKEVGARGARQHGMQHARQRTCLSGPNALAMA